MTQLSITGLAQIRDLLYQEANALDDAAAAHVADDEIYNSIMDDRDSIAAMHKKIDKIIAARCKG
jgi:hypothetical protein